MKASPSKAFGRLLVNVARERGLGVTDKFEPAFPAQIALLDAHADYNTPATTISGNMHGMSSAFLCGEPGLEGLLGEEPRTAIKPDRLELFGVRSIDKSEMDLLRKRRISIADMRQLDEFGVGVLIRRVIEKVKSRNGVLHVSFDVDFIDPNLAPGVG